MEEEEEEEEGGGGGGGGNFLKISGIMWFEIGNKLVMDEKENLTESDIKVRL